MAAEKLKQESILSQGSCSVGKEITYTKFDASLDIDVRLQALTTRKANQMVRVLYHFPHGTGKVVRVLVLCTPDEAAAKEAGADMLVLTNILKRSKVDGLILM